METAAKLKKAGIPFAFQSGFESYVPKTRVVLYEAGVAAANGLTFDEALVAATINGAYSVDRHETVGSLEAGKQFDAVLISGPAINLLRVNAKPILEVFKRGQSVGSP
jgi:imidazolonepropionase-like amidohydrolase